MRSAFNRAHLVLQPLEDCWHPVHGVFHLPVLFTAAGQKFESPRIRVWGLLFRVGNLAKLPSRHEGLGVEFAGFREFGVVALANCPYGIPAAYSPYVHEYGLQAHMRYSLCEVAVNVANTNDFCLRRQ